MEDMRFPDAAEASLVVAVPLAFGLLVIVLVLVLLLLLLVFVSSGLLFFGITTVGFSTTVGLSSGIIIGVNPSPSTSPTNEMVPPERPLPRRWDVPLPIHLPPPDDRPLLRTWPLPPKAGHLRFFKDALRWGLLEPVALAFFKDALRWGLLEPVALAFALAPPPECLVPKALPNCPKLPVRPEKAVNP